MRTLVYASLVAISVVTGVAAMMPYALTVNPAILGGGQGAARGTLGFWQEIALICAYSPLGISALRRLNLGWCT